MKYGLVLSGGGSKGAYESGCMKALQELGYHFDIVTGTFYWCFKWATCSSRRLSKAL